jgi:hypothetical protein
LKNFVDFSGELLFYFNEKELSNNSKLKELNFGDKRDIIYYEKVNFFNKNFRNQKKIFLL